MLYVSPVYVALHLPDTLAVHYLHYYVYVRTLHFFQSMDELIDIEQFFFYYYEHLPDYYGAKSQLLSVHLHLHLKEQMIKHGSLLFTSCFARESYLGHCLKWCHGKKYILEQFITWYLVDRSLSGTSAYDINRVFFDDKLDDKHLNKKFIDNYRDKLSECFQKKNINCDSITYFARYHRGMTTFHSIAYARNGNGISYRVSISNDTCPMQRQSCFGEVLFYLSISNVQYAFVKKYDCIDGNIADGISTVNVPQKLKEKLNYFYGFYNHRRYRYKAIPIRLINNKVISMQWRDGIFTYTDIFFDMEHD